MIKAVENIFFSTAFFSTRIPIRLDLCTFFEDYLFTHIIEFKIVVC